MPRTATARKPVQTTNNQPKPKKSESVLLVTPVGRLNYPYLYKKDEGRPNSDNKYKVDIMIPKEVWKEQSAELRDAVTRVARSANKNQNLTLKDFKHPFIDGDTKKYDEMKGHVILRCKSDYKPAVIGPDRSEFNEERIKAIKSGDYGRASVVAKWYPHQGGGVALFLNVLQFAREGEALGGDGGRTASLELLDEISIELDDLEGDEGSGSVDDIEGDEEGSDDNDDILI